MISTAIGKYMRVSPRKARPVADLVRGKNVEEAMNILKFSPKKASKIIASVIKSAIANAEENKNYRDISKLKVSEIKIDNGPFLKRYIPRAYGRATPIKRRTSHITVVLAE